MFIQLKRTDGEFELVNLDTVLRIKKYKNHCIILFNVNANLPKQERYVFKDEHVYSEFYDHSLEYLESMLRINEQMIKS